MMMKKILIITNTITSFGGGEKWALEVAVRIKGKYDITIASPKAKSSLQRISMEDMSKMFDLRGIKLVDLDSIGLKSASFESDKFLFMVPKIKGLSELSKLIKETDAIYLMSFNPVLFTSSIMLANAYGKKLVVGIHNPTFSKIFDKRAGIKQRGLNRAFIAVSKMVRYFHVLNDRDLKLVSTHFPSAKPYLIPVFIYKPEPKFDGKQKEFVTLFIGRLETSQKGIDMLCHVVERTLKENGKIIYHIIGGKGDGEEMVRRLVQQYPKNVVLASYVPDSVHVMEFMKASMCISTSRYETFPAFILEAQSYGLYTVAFDIEGANTIMKDKSGGKLIRPFDVNGFADAVLDYYKRWASLGKEYTKERERISKATYKRYSEGSIVPMIEAMFDGLMKKNR